jgi:hemolysin activation/secretion protein
MEPQRYAGDGAVYASAELRVPLNDMIGRLPLDWGVLGLADAGRVYVDGESPGGWHPVTGYGLWFGLRGHPLKVVTLTMVSEVGHTGLHLRAGLGF